MIGKPEVKKILFGGDYNPEQWDEEARKQDMELLPEAKIDIVTLNVFSWAKLQPSEDTYDFSDLDSIIQMVTKAGMNICLATSTAAHPAWMAHKYPDILRTDIEGRKRQFGGRHNSCPSSPTYRKYSVLLAQKLAERYKNQKNILAWHISNEYGGLCYCENCAREFRIWLKEKYKTIDALNAAWNTSFWGHTYYDFEEIQAPMHTNERWATNRTSCQIQTIDYYRFQNQALLNCYRAERDAIKKITPDIPVTTNLMSTYPELNYHEWAPYMDFVSWDNYPSPEDPYTRTAFNHEVMRGLIPSKPFCLMEQTPSVTNWQPYNSLKRPGVMRLQSYQAVAHGADTVMFFQMRRSRGCCEKFHGAVIDHYATNQTRVFKETKALGTELQNLGDKILSSVQKPQAALLFDWNCMWGLMFSAGPSVDLKYTDEVFKYYDAFSRENIPVDVISPESDFSSYKLIVAPAFYMLSEETAERIKKFTENGGTFVTTTMSGITDMNDLICTNGYPGPLKELCGIWAEETDALYPSQSNVIRIEGKPNLNGDYKSVILCDVVHSEGAEVIGTFQKDFYSGSPAVTKNSYGKGFAWYIASCMPKNDTSLARNLLREICSENKISAVAEPVSGIEATERFTKDGKAITFILNHNETSSEITVPKAGTDLLTGRSFKHGEKFLLAAKDLLIVME